MIPGFSAATSLYRSAHPVGANPTPSDVDFVIGVKGPIAQPDMCDDLLADIVAYDQTYSSMINAIPRPEAIPATEFEAADVEVFEKIQQMADNTRAIDEFRVANYLAVRYPAIYAAAAEAHVSRKSVSEIRVIGSRLGSTRKIVDVVISYRNRTTDVIDNNAFVFMSLTNVRF
jgi:hypothetical protein